MADDMTWRMLVEDFRRGYLTPDEARVALEEISYELDEDLLEKIEDMIFEKEEKDLLAGAMWADSLPQEAEDAGYGVELMDQEEDYDDWGED